MKINNIKRLSRNKKLLASVITVVVVLIVAIFIYAFYGSNSHKSTQTPASSSGSDQTQNNNTPSSDATTQPSIDSAASNSVKTTTTTSTNPSTTTPSTPTSNTVSIDISSTQQTAATYKINTIIYSVESEGTCTLTLTKSGSTTITQTAGIQALPSSSTCKGFDVPMSQLSQGQWQLSLAFSNTTDNGIVTQSIEVK